MSDSDQIKYLAYSSKIAQIVSKSNLDLTECAKVLICLEGMLNLVVTDQEEVYE